MTRLKDYESYNGKYIVQLTKDPQRSPESKKYKTFDQAKRAGINCLKYERYFESAFDMTREEWLECSLVDEIPNEFYIRQIETYKPTPLQTAQMKRLQHMNCVVYVLRGETAVNEYLDVHSIRLGVEWKP